MHISKATNAAIYSDKLHKTFGLKKTTKQNIGCNWNKVL